MRSVARVRLLVALATGLLVLLLAGLSAAQASAPARYVAVDGSVVHVADDGSWSSVLAGRLDAHGLDRSTQPPGAIADPAADSADVLTTTWKSRGRDGEFPIPVPFTVTTYRRAMEDTDTFRRRFTAEVKSALVDWPQAE